MGEESIGLFVAAYEIGTGLRGAPTLHLRLAVSAPDRTVSGVCTVTQATTPGGERFAATVSGTFALLGPLPAIPASVFVNAIGYPPGTPRESMPAPTFGLDMLLDERWNAGIANFRYLETRIDGAKVTLVQPRAVSEIHPSEIRLDQPSRHGLGSLRDQLA
jgi:hypothetical protein